MNVFHRGNRREVTKIILILVLILGLDLPACLRAASPQDVKHAQEVLKEAEAEEQTKKDAEAKKAKVKADEDAKRDALAAEAKKTEAKSTTAAVAATAEGDYEDRVDDLAGKVRTLTDLVGRTKIQWSTQAFYRTSAVSPLTPTAVSQDAYIAGTVDVEKYFEKNFTGMLTLRAIKPIGGDDSVSLDLLTARFNYSLSWLRASVGRQSFAKFFSSTEFLGNIMTAGIHRMDAVTITIPLLFSTEVDDRGSYKSPPTAITYGYVPRLLPLSETTIPNGIRDAGYQFGQLRVAVAIERWGVENVLKFNMGQGTTSLILSSPLGDGLSFSAVYDLTVAKSYSLYYEYGIQNSSRPSTSAMVIGAKLANFHDKIIVLDQVVFETLLPGKQDVGNVLTGGNPQTFGVGAEVPVPVWYVRVSNTFGKWELGGAATNSWGDYTFGRIRQGSLTTPLSTPVGPVNEIDGQAVSLLANATTPLAYYVYSNYHF